MAAAIALLGLPSAGAHNVNVYAYLETGRMVVQGYFGGKAKAVDCVVELLDGEGTKLADGRTDASGVCAFRLTDLPRLQGDLKVVLHAGMGHRAEFTLTAAELAGGANSTGAASEQRPQTKDRPETATIEGNYPVTDQTGLKKAMEEALDSRLQPLVAMIGNQQKLLLEQKNKGPGVIEAIGGIGWILGIFGLAAYFMSRRRGG